MCFVCKTRILVYYKKIKGIFCLQCFVMIIKLPKTIYFYFKSANSLQ